MLMAHAIQHAPVFESMNAAPQVSDLLEVSSRIEYVAPELIRIIVSLWEFPPVGHDSCDLGQRRELPYENRAGRKGRPPVANHSGHKGRPS